MRVNDEPVIRPCGGPFVVRIEYVVEARRAGQWEISQENLPLCRRGGADGASDLPAACRA